MLRWPWIAALIAACHPVEVIPLPSESGTMVVVARIVEGRLTEVAMLSPDREVVGLPARRGEVLATFSFPSAHVVNGAGEPMATSAPRVALVGSEMTQEGCGRCSADFSSPPSIVQPGDVCPPPRFAKIETFRVGESLEPIDPPLAVEDLRQSIRIVWPGPCECTPPSHRSGDATELSIVAGHLPVEAVASSPEGGVAIFSERQALYRGAAPASSSQTPFEGNVHGAVGLPGDRFLVASHIPVLDERRNVQFHVLDRTLQIEPRNLDSIALLPQKMRRFEPEGLVLLAGRGRVKTPALKSCNGDMQCAEIAPALAIDTQFVDVTRMASGLVAVAGNLGGLVLLQRLTGPSETPAANRILPAVDEDLREVVALAALDDRLFMCGVTGSGNQVYSATVSADAIDPSVPIPTWAIGHCQLGARCTALTATAGVMRAHFEGGGHADFSSEGTPLTGRTSDCTDPIQPFPGSGVDRPIRYVDGDLVVTVDDAVYFRGQQVHGGEYVAGHAAGIVAANDTFFILASHGAQFDVGGNLDVRTLNGIAPTEIPTAAAFDGERIFASGTCAPPCTAWARWTTLEGETTELEAPFAFVPTAAASVAPGVVVAIGGQQVAVVKQQTVEVLNLDVTVRSVSGARGVAWLGGDAGALYRLNVYAMPPYADEMNPLLPDPILFDPTRHGIPSLSAVRALCAGDVIFAAKAAGTDVEEESGWVWQLGDELSGYAGNVGGALSRRPSGDPQALLGPPDHMAILTTNRGHRFSSFHRFSSETRTFLSLVFTAAAENDRGDVLVGAENGRLLLFRRSP